MHMYKIKGTKSFLKIVNFLNLWFPAYFGDGGCAQPTVKLKVEEALKSQSLRKI